MKKVIAIDGPAGAGKSTVAKRVAERLGFCLLDTGALYRLVALHLLRNEVAATADCVPHELLARLDARIEPAVGAMRLFLNDEDVSDSIRTEEVGIAASRFSAKPEVRQRLFDYQRAAALQWDIVAEGRDMGTVVFPDAFLKLFVTASLEERANRRHLELRLKGSGVDLAEVLREMRDRDDRDVRRAVSPLVKAPDAVEIDTTGMELAAVVESVIRLYETKATG